MPGLKGFPLLVVATLVVVGIGVGICSATGNDGGSSASPPQASTPVGGVEMWFRAINDRDLGALEAAFMPETNAIAAWSDTPAAEWSHYSGVTCRQHGPMTARTANVSCSFHEIAGPAAGNPDTFFDFFLQHLDGAWRVDSYGQG